MVVKNFAAQILVRRYMSGLSQQGFADKLGISRMTLSQIENEHSTVTLGTLDQIAKALKIKPENLIKEVRLEE